MFLDPANTRLKRPYNFGHIAVKLQAGQLVVFPSYLVHEVATFLGSDWRITVAVNTWFSERSPYSAR
jgi:predicted 2-oxoglutarate/Fe(II)-dependent dioxygenase YbiX